MPRGSRRSAAAAPMGAAATRAERFAACPWIKFPARVTGVGLAGPGGGSGKPYLKADHRAVSWVGLSHPWAEMQLCRILKSQVFSRGRLFRVRSMVFDVFP